jgi:hypothetical protein
VTHSVDLQTQVQFDKLGAATGGQTLEVLHSRGGLAPEELWLAAHGLGLRELHRVTESAAGRWLTALVAAASRPTGVFVEEHW